MAVTGNTEHELNFEVGLIYLVENHYYHTKSYQEVYVERITGVAYKFRKERANGTWYIEWEEKKKFHQRNTIIEFLEKPKLPPTLECELDGKNVKDNVSFIVCYHCNGDGHIPDDNSSTGTRVCPKCWGSKYIADQICNLI